MVRLRIKRKRIRKKIKDLKFYDFKNKKLYFFTNVSRETEGYRKHGKREKQSEGETKATIEGHQGRRGLVQFLPQLLLLKFQHETVLGLPLVNFSNGLVDLLGLIKGTFDDLDLWNHLGLGRKLEHMLDVLTASDEGTTYGPSSAEKLKGSELDLGGGDADQHKLSIGFQQVEIRIPIHVRRGCEHDKIIRTFDRGKVRLLDVYKVV